MQLARLLPSKAKIGVADITTVCIIIKHYVPEMVPYSCGYEYSSKYVFVTKVIQLTLSLLWCSIGGASIHSFSLSSNGNEK